MINKFRLQYIPFIIANTSVKIIYESFPGSRKQFSKLWGMRLYKLVFFIMQGITVPNEFLAKSINKYFEGKLFTHDAA